MSADVAVKERPILFSGRLVRAILEGRKSVTRRVVKPQPDGGPRARMVDLGSAFGLEDGCLSGEWRCPYGQPGDRLWVRETHYVWEAGYKDGTGRRISYRATEPDAPTTWTPSIHMPRWASRISLEVTGVRVERLQEITPDEAIAEGVVEQAHEERQKSGRRDLFNGRARGVPYLVNAFAELWNDSNKPRGYGWEANPFVWVIRFKPLPTSSISTNGDPE